MIIIIVTEYVADQLKGAIDFVHLLLGGVQSILLLTVRQRAIVIVKRVVFGYFLLLMLAQATTPIVCHFGLLHDIVVDEAAVRRLHAVHFHLRVLRCRRVELLLAGPLYFIVHFKLVSR